MGLKMRFSKFCEKSMHETCLIFLHETARAYEIKIDQYNGISSKNLVLRFLGQNGPEMETKSKVLSKIYAWHLKLHGTSYSNIKTSDMGQIGFSSSWKTIAWNLPDFLRQVAIVCRRYLAVFGPNETRSEPKVRIFRCYKKLMWKDLG